MDCIIVLRVRTVRQVGWRLKSEVSHKSPRPRGPRWRRPRSARRRRKTHYLASLRKNNAKNTTWIPTSFERKNKKKGSVYGLHKKCTQNDKYLLAGIRAKKRTHHQGSGAKNIPGRKSLGSVRDVIRLWMSLPTLHETRASMTTASPKPPIIRYHTWDEDMKY